MKSCSKYVPLFVLALAPICLSAETILFDYSHPWKYNGDGLEPGNAWRALNYDDASWRTGPGVFASFNETLLDRATIGTLLATSVSNRYITNFYFRTSFLQSQVPAGHVLYATNQIDDGAVIYLNGSEVGRFAMPNGAVTANTFATRSDDVVTHGVEVLRIETTNLLATNIFAAEVHQGSAASGDIVWAMKLASVPAPPQITSQPQSRSSAVGGSIAFEVSAKGGGPIDYQWYKDGVPLFNATNATFVLADIQASDAGSYWVLVSNALATATSSNASLIVGCLAPAAFTNEPLGQTLTAGGTLNLSANASGTAPILLQWYRNGTPISGAIGPTFTKTNVAPADSGIYFAVASNCSGSTASSNAVVSIAAPPYALLGLTNTVWRYNESGLDLGTAWRLPNYNDSGWPAGRGVLAQENNVAITRFTNTVLHLTNPSGNVTITYYFRTQFVLTNDLADVSLVASNLIDDGCVVYLNGSEAYRINMPGGVITATDLATAALPEGVFIVTNFPPELLLPGTNVIAVEVHQLNTTSSDVVFGLQADVTFPAPMPLSISEQPADVQVEEAKPAVFSAHVIGGGARLQWYKDGAPIPGATGSTFALGSVAVADRGSYSLRASNAFGIVFSRLARLQVLVDSTPPQLVAGDIVDDSTVLLSFSERMAASSATNPQNYFITNTLGGTIAVLGAAPTNGTNVLLRTAALLPNRNYIARVNGLTDASPGANVIASGSLVPLARTLMLSPFNATWDFYDPVPPFDDPDPGPDWKELAHNVSEFWGAGPGVFYNGFDPSEVSSSVGTFLSQSEAVAAYFRNQFVSGASRAGLRLHLRHIVDDGAVFYLNGTEISRFNMAAGPVTFASPSAVAASTISLVDAGEVSALSFRTGSNLFAVELHQVLPADEDKAFAAELIARVESFVLGPLFVTSGPDDITIVEGAAAEFTPVTVGVENFQWQSGSSFAAGATNIPGATNPVYRIEHAPLSFDGLQFRVRVSNANSFLITTSATLHVVADTNPPALLAASAPNDSSIAVTFSKPLSAATATNQLNYTITNLNGGTVIPTAATLVNETNVILSFASSLAGCYVVEVNNVTDTSSTANPVASGSAVAVSAHYFLPMDGAWKYLLINTNDAVQRAFMGMSFDDSLWQGPSNALLYVESARLPGPQNTPLSLFDDTGSNRIQTFYFRKGFLAPIVNGPVIFNIRHIIDDGLVLYLNGAEIYRFNMGSGAVTAASAAQTSIGDATLLGPFNVVVTNLVPGPNVLAADVHQSASPNSDVVFGVEIGATVDSGPTVAPPPAPRLVLTHWGQEFALEWEGIGTLEQAADVGGPWQPVSVASPSFVAPSNVAAFFRVRR